MPRAARACRRRAGRTRRPRCDRRRSSARTQSHSLELLSSPGCRSYRLGKTAARYRGLRGGARVGRLARADAERRRCREADRHHERDGDEDEVIPRHDDGQHHCRRIEAPGRAQEKVARVQRQPDPERQSPTGVKTRHGGNGIREALVVRLADVDPRVQIDRVPDPHVRKPGRRSGVAPVDDERDGGGEEEPVPEDREPLAVAPVEPDEERARRDEVAREVEPVHPPHELREPQEPVLNALLPGKVAHLLETEDLMGVRRRLWPIGRNQPPEQAVRLGQPDHEADLKHRIEPVEEAAGSAQRANTLTMGRTVQSTLVTRVAAVDIGTNSTRLLVADISNGRIADIERETRVTRLGEGVDARRRLLPVPVARVRNVLADYRRTLESLGAERTLAVATSAIRDAENGEAFLGEIEWSYGFSTRLLSGHDEAMLMFRGVTSDRELAAGTVIVDVGGGSTELVAAEPDGVRWHDSLDIGSVRLTERFLRTDPPTPDELDACATAVRALLAERVPDEIRSGTHSAVGVAGTITSIAAL